MHSLTISQSPSLATSCISPRCHFIVLTREKFHLFAFLYTYYTFSSDTMRWCMAHIVFPLPRQALRGASCVYTLPPTHIPHRTVCIASTGGRSCFFVFFLSYATWYNKNTQTTSSCLACNCASFGGYVFKKIATPFCRSHFRFHNIFWCPFPKQYFKLLLRGDVIHTFPCFCGI